MAIWDRTENWLAGIGEANDANHSIKGGAGGLSAEMVQASFDVTYSKRMFTARDHGSIITVWSAKGHAAETRRSAERSRALGKTDRADLMEAKATAIETQGQAYFDKAA